MGEGKRGLNDNGQNTIHFFFKEEKAPLMLKGQAFKFPGDFMQLSLLGLTG